MSTVYFPIIAKPSVLGLKHFFSAHGITYGMAGEYTSFDSSTQSPIIKRHASIFTTETSMKMYYTQPQYGQYDFTYPDALIAKCQENGIDVHGHCAVWHAQNPDWLWTTLQGMDIDARYQVLHNHIKALVQHYSGLCVSMDVVNEYGAAGELDGWGYYLGRDCVKYAFETAREHAGNMKLYYNSFFPHDDDVDLAIEMLPYTDGIGVQLHLGTWQDIPLKFARVRRMADACKQAGKTMRFSEVTCCGDTDTDYVGVAELYRKIVLLALEYPGVVNNITTWGVKGKAWNNYWTLFDGTGKPMLQYYAVVEALK